MRNNPQNYIPGAPGVKFNKAKKVWGRRKYNPNVVNVAAMIPAGIGMAAGIGQLGRKDGYAMVVPSEDDPRQTDNVIAELGARYILSREGRLLDADDALLERPDLSYADYQKYKGYLRDRDIDLNPLDGTINIGGILKTNPDGIHGPEMNFMGKTLDVNTTLLPTATAILGSIGGSAATRRLNLSKRGNIGTLFGGGMLGLATGSLAGQVIEGERRRRNFEENNPGVDYNLYKQNAAELLKQKQKIARENPNREAERAESRTGFSKRSQQGALLQEQLKQQTLIDQLVSEENRRRALEANTKRELAAEQFNQIEQSIGGG